MGLLAQVVPTDSQRVDQILQRLAALPCWAVLTASPNGEQALGPADQGGQAVGLLSEVDLSRLRRADGRLAGPPPAGPSPGALAASRCVEVDRLVNGIGGVTLLNRLILVGSPLAGQRARLRLDGQLMYVLTQDGVPCRTLPCPLPPGQRHRLQGARLAGPAPLPEATVTVQRRVSSRGGIQVAHQKIQVGMTHAGKIVTVVPQPTPSGWSSTARPSPSCPAPPATRSTVTRPTRLTPGRR
jgi:hypothetical protein